MVKPTRTEIKLLSPSVVFEGLTLHGLLNSVDTPSISPGPDGRLLRTPR